MGDDFAPEGVVAHLQQVAEEVLRARGGTRALHILHRKAAEHQPLDQARERTCGHLCDAFRVADRILEAVLHRVPRRVVPFRRAELVGEDPVRPRRHLRHQVGEAARRHPRRSCAHHVEVGEDRPRRRAGIGLLRALGAADRRAEAGVAVHARRGRDDHVGPPELARRELDEVVDHARADRHRHRPVVRMRFAGRLDRPAHLVYIAVVGVEGGAAGLDDVRVDGDSRVREQLRRPHSGRRPGARVEDEHRPPRLRELRLEEVRRLRDRAVADDAGPGVYCSRKRASDCIARCVHVRLRRVLNEREGVGKRERRDKGNGKGGTKAGIRRD